jgi:hypothetical protein
MKVTDKNTITNMTISRKKISKLKMVGVISSILLLSLAIFSMIDGRSIALAQQQPVIPPLPQPNAPKVLKVNASGPALFVPDLGLASFYGPKFQKIPPGIIEQPGVFPCSGDPVKCGKPVPGTFDGLLENGNKDNITSVNATYKSIVNAGVQLKNHVYKITTTHFTWNSTDSELPTTQPGFTKPVPVIMGAQQHGASRIDRPDVPQISENPGGLMYGRCDVTDMNTSQKVANVFCHLMVGHLVNETNFYKYMRDDPLTPTLAIVIAASIPANTQLPGNWSPYCSSSTMCSAAQAQQFFPYSATGSPPDESLTKPPPFAYPVSLQYPRIGSIEAPGPSYEQPVSIKHQPFFFAFVVYPGADVRELKLEKTSSGK